MPMRGAMAAETLRTMRHLLLASATAQLMLGGAGMLALAGLFGGVGAVGAALALEAALLLLVVAVLVCSSARAGRRAIEGYESTPSDLLDDVIHLAPRVVTQVGVLVAGCTATWFVAMGAATMHPLAGLIALPLALVATGLVSAPLLLALGAIASGDASWLPGAAFRVVRAAPWRAFTLACAGMALAFILALPVALTGFIASVLLGPVGSVGYGLVAVSAVPWLGCGSLAAWLVLGGDELLRERAEVAAGSVAIDPDSTTTPVHALLGDRSAGVPDAWVAGPTWDVAVEAGSAFGTWVRMPAASRVAFAVSWHVGAPPELSIAGPDGAWWRPGDLSASGAQLVAELPAGDSYLQLSSRSAVPQAIHLAMLLPAHAVA